MTSPLTLSDHYKGAFRAGTLWMIGLGVLSVSTLDMGQANVCFRLALIAYWMLFALILFRRPAKPTFADLMALKWAFPSLYLVGFLVYPYVERWRGFR